MDSIVMSSVSADVHALENTKPADGALSNVKKMDTYAKTVLQPSTAQPLKDFSPVSRLSSVSYREGTVIGRVKAGADAFVSINSSK